MNVQGHRNHVPKRMELNLKMWGHTAAAINLVFLKQTALGQHSKRKVYYGFNFHLRINQINHQSKVQFLCSLESGLSSITAPQ